MRRLILAAMLAATAAPGLAQSNATPVAPPTDLSQYPRRDARQDQRDVRQDNRDERTDRGDVRQDNRDVRQDQRQLGRDAATGVNNPGDRRDLRQDDRRDDQDRRDVRQDDRREFQDRRDYRQDDRRDDHRDYSRDGRGGYGFRDDRRGYGSGDAYARFRGPAFAYPRGYGYRYYGVGAILPRVFFDNRFYLDPYAYRLPPAYGGTRWIRVGPDALLIRAYDGRVVRVIQGLFY